MHTKTMEGLIGARTNMDMTNVPMRVFKEARRKDDTATMERAMGYVNDFENRADQYKNTAEEGMKEEAKEAKEKAKQELEEKIEKSREERKELEAQREQARIESQKTPADHAVEISSEGHSLSAQSTGGRTAALPDGPVFYSSSGTANAADITQSKDVKLNVSI